MQIQHLWVFFEVAKLGSISAAARSLRIAQPSISRTVLNLENSLNRKLFDRNPRGISLTDEGKKVFERCQTIFRECEAISSDLRSEIKRVRIAASDNLCLHVFPSILQSLQPLIGISFEFISGTAEEVIHSVINGHSDIGYCYHMPQMPGLSCQAVTKVNFVIVAQRKWFVKKPSFNQLRKIPFIGSRNRDYKGPYAAKVMLSQVGINAPDAGTLNIQCNSQEGQIAFAGAGLGYTVVPWFAVQDRVRRKEMIIVPTPRPLSTTLYRIEKIGSGSNFLMQKLEAELTRSASMPDQLF